jgi:putative endonuclease
MRKWAWAALAVHAHLLMQRISQHRKEYFKGFAEDKGIKMLALYEQHETMEAAILREKRIKKWNRQWKINLIEEQNPDWKDFAVDWGFEPVWTLK